MTPRSAEQKNSASEGNGNGSGVAEFEPPLACVRRLLKTTLPNSTNVGKDACAAFSRACGIFVLYVTACANDFARENRRQTITANDVLAAMKELDFDDFTPQLTTFLERHRAEERSKKESKARISMGESDGGGGTAVATEGGSSPTAEEITKAQISSCTTRMEEDEEEDEEEEGALSGSKRHNENNENEDEEEDEDEDDNDHEVAVDEDDDIEEQQMTGPSPLKKRRIHGNDDNENIGDGSTNRKLPGGPESGNNQVGYSRGNHVDTTGGYEGVGVVEDDDDDEDE